MDRIRGQARAIGVLQTQWAAERMHHAYIFHGPAGVGKFTTAVALARLLLCHNPATNLTGAVEACGACPSCRLLPADADRPEAIAHPDLHVIRKELAAYSDDAQVRARKQLSIPVEIVRRHLIEPAGLAPQLKHGKVFIIDEAELLNASSQNVLLKTLEEPPADTTIILVTSSEDRLLPTIRSRCQRVPFTPLSDGDVEWWLDQQGAELGASERAWLLGFANGSLGRARLALDHGLASWAETMLPMLDAMASGRPAAGLGAELADRIKAFAEKWVKDHPNASKEAANRMAAGLGFSILTTYARQRIAGLAADGEPGALADAEARLDPWLGVIDAAADAERLLSNNVNLSLVCDHLTASAGRRLMAAAR